MAYETGSSTDLADLLGDISTFLTANGWTEDWLDTGAGRYGFSKNSVYVTGRWVVGDPVHLTINQALGFVNTSTDPGKHTDDSGNGYDGAVDSNSNYDNERCVLNIGDGPFTYWFFEKDSGPAYFHCVVEISSGVFRHFGWGELDKIGTWTGGEYAYGHYGAQNTPTSANSTFLLDGGAGTTNSDSCATVHAEGLPAQDGSSKWLNCWGSSSVAPTDEAGNPKQWCSGGFRSGPLAKNLGATDGASASSGLVAGYPLAQFYVDATNSRVYQIGYVADVRAVNVANFSNGQEVTIGSDDWLLFPLSSKTTAVDNNSTRNLGVMYKKVTA